MNNIKFVELESKKYYSNPDLIRHINLVKKYAVILGEIEGADIEIVEIAAILHDIGKYKGRENHDKIGYEVSKQILDKTDLSNHKKELILNCVSKHRSSFSQEENELEVKIVQSADALGTFFDDEWQEISRKEFNKDDLLKLYNKSFNKINLESARKLVKPRINELKRILLKTK
jgi:putative nucleotidyltransferase with HDIG domain